MDIINSINKVNKFCKFINKRNALSVTENKDGSYTVIKIAKDYYWIMAEYDNKGNKTFVKNSRGYWERSFYNQDGTLNYKLNGSKYWKINEKDSVIHGTGSTIYP